MKSLPADKDLSDKEFTLKLAMMLALTLTSRYPEISYSNINFTVKTEGKYIFSFNKLTKVCCRSKSQPTLTFQEFEQDKSLCCFSVRYLYRGRTGKKSFVKPHNEVVNSTILGCMKEVLKQSAINAEHFKARSTRSASSSKAQMSRPPVEQIFKRGNWSTKFIWQKFYNKNIEVHKTFGQAVLENVGTLQTEDAWEMCC